MVIYYKSPEHKKAKCNSALLKIKRDKWKSINQTTLRILLAVLKKDIKIFFYGETNIQCSWK